MGNSSIFIQGVCEKITAGCDEVGRDCLAGPVIAAVVILPNEYNPFIS